MHQYNSSRLFRKVEKRKFILHIDRENACRTKISAGFSLFGLQGLLFRFIFNINLYSETMFFRKSGVEHLDDKPVSQPVDTDAEKLRSQRA